MSLFIPTYFSPIAQYSAIYKSDNIVFEVEDNFQKQTYRNRSYIYGANGKLALTVPIKHKKTKERKKTKDTMVENDFPWQSQHLKSLKTAYQTSPYFEFFEDDIQKIFTKKYQFLIDLNIDTYLFITDALQINTAYTKTKNYEVQSSLKDFRNLSLAKKGVTTEMDEYTQMFDDKYGFIPNLSILDLLFMEGSNTLTFLEKMNFMI